LTCYSASKWAIPFNIRTPPVEEQWNSSGERDKSGGILQGKGIKAVEFFRGKRPEAGKFFRGKPIL